MQVILTEKVTNLGDIGDIVKVKSGYGRNFLIPQGKAETASKANLELFEANRAEFEKKANVIKAAAQARADALKDVEVSIAARASEEGKLFGSVGPKEIADAIVAKGHELEKREVLMPEGPFHELGEHDVQLQLHSDVAANIKVIIVAE